MQENKIPEALNYDIDVPCVVQWGMLWYSAPTSLDNDSLNGGVVLAKYNETGNLAIKGSSILSFLEKELAEILFLAGTLFDDDSYTSMVCGHQKGMGH